MSKKLYFLIFIVGILAVLAMLVFSIPQIYDRVSFRVDELTTKIKYAIQPPQKVVFNPGNVTESAIIAVPTISVTSTQAHVVSSATLASIIPTLEATPTLIPLPSSTPTKSPLPPEVTIQGGKYVDQHGLLNYCAPANLAVLLSYWGWKGDRIDIGKVVKPYNKDKNVMPYELADYVKNNTDLNSIIRVGGDMDTIKQFVAAGFPVLIEKGYFVVDIYKVYSWMGHYNVITGYNDAEGYFLVQDTYLQPNMKIPYDEIVNQWRDFNFTYMVAFSSDRYNDVMKILGPDADEQTNYQRAADKASNEIVKFKNDPVEDFFAWFNRGDNLAELQDYGNAANCYDEAWKIYPTISEDTRPWRVIWYRTGIYKAYFGAGRYQAVVDLATTTLNQMSEPYIEESYYWRARGEWELGRKQEATADFHQSLVLHKDFGPTLYQMELLGIK